MKKIIATCALLAGMSLSFAQTHVVLSEDFESGGTNWFNQGNTIENEFIFNTCAGNGPSEVGTNAAYVSNGGGVAGCGPTGDIHFGYENSVASNDSIVVYHLVDATCLTSVSVDFDYILEGDPGLDYGHVVYSTDAGTSWTEVGPELSGQATWTNTTQSLPVSLAGTSFLLGFKFDYNNTNDVTLPFAIDNVVVSGNDNQAPVVTCVGAFSYDASANCDYELEAEDFKDFVTGVSDNCSDSADITLSFTPVPGTIIPANTPTNIVVTATDEAGNSSQCNFDLTIIDNTAPIVTCPSDTNIYLNNSCEYSMGDFESLLTIQENCSALGDLIIDQSIAIGTTFNTPNTSQNVGFTVEDEAGNVGSCSFNLLFADSTKPVVVCPIDTVVYVNGACSGSIGDYVAGASVTDNCSSLMTITQSPVPGTLVAGESTTTLITMSADDGNGNIGTCVFNAVNIDTIAPTITCPGTQSENGDASCESALGDYTGSAISGLDNCSATTISQSPMSGSTISGATNTITLTIQDADGNSSSCDFNVEVIDVTGPTVVCPNDTTVPVSASCLANLPDYTIVSSGTDNCAMTTFSPVQTPAVGAPVFGAGTVVAVTIEADDDAGNTGSCIFNVTLIDTLKPSISCPSNSTENADANCEYVLPDYSGMGISVNDNCSAPGNITITQSVPAGSGVPSGVNTIILTAEDEGGNQETCSFDITVVDVTDPVITTCPSDQGVFSDASCVATLIDYTDQVVATDNCSAFNDITITQSPLPGLVVSGSQLINITIEDEAGNTDQCSFTVTKADSTAPVVTCPSDQNVTADASCNYTVGDYIPMSSATDNCSLSGDLIFSQSPLNASIANGLTEVTISVEDEAGNVGTCTFNLIPTDVTAPVITDCGENDTLYVDASCEAVVPDYSGQVVATDACGGLVVTQSIAIGSILTAGTTNIEMTVTDPGMNTDQCTFDIVVLDTISPTIDCPNDTNICTSLFTYTEPVGVDNCSGATTTQIDGSGFTSGSDFPLGQTILQYEVEDVSGNTSSCLFRVTVLDWSDTAEIITDDIELCDTITTVIEAEAPTNGTGAWDLISGSAVINNNGAAFTGVNNIDPNAGEVVIVWEVTNSSGCPESSDTIRINVYEEPTIANVGFDVKLCADTFELDGNVVLKGNGMWEHLEGGANFDDPTDPITNVYDLPEGDNTFVWTISNGSCPSTSDTMVVTRVAQPTVANILSSDTTICDSQLSIVVESEEPDFGNAGWALVQGSGSFGDQDSTVNEISGLSGGENIFVWVVNNDICNTIADTISITVEICGETVIVPTLLTPNFDGKNDLWVIPYLNDFYPDCRVEVYSKWGVKVFESEGYPEPWDCKYKEEALPAGAYFYSIDLGTGADPLTGSLTILK